MRETTYGKMLYSFRLEKGLKINEICEGICTAKTLSRFEREENVPDTLLFERLLERIGVSTEEICIMVNKKEYLYYTWREEVYESIEEKNVEKLDKLLKSNICDNVYCNKQLEKQFFFYAKGILYGIREDYTKAIFFLKKAIIKSMPNILEQLKSKLILSTVEIHMLLLYLYYGVKADIIKLEEGKYIFFTLEQYLYDSYSDKNEKVKCYSKLICIGLHLFADTLQESIQLQFCKKAADMLRENKSFEDITELLRLYILLLEKRESREVKFYQKQYEVFCDLLQTEGLDIGFCPEILNISRTKIYRMDEYFFAKRKEKGLTQEVLTEEICTTETYSRIETGTREPKPQNYKALVDKLEIGWCYYRGELDTCELKAFELRRKQRNAEIEGKRYESLDFLDELEACVNKNNVINKQYIEFARCISMYRIGRLTIEEASAKLEELLYLTQKMEIKDACLKYYSQTELEIIGHLAQLFRIQGKYEEGIQLCEIVIKQMQYSDIGFEQQWNGFSIILRALSNLYFGIENYEISMKILKYVKKVDIKRKKGSSLPAQLDAIADNLEHMGRQYSEEYKKLYRYTYYVADFFKIEKVTNFSKNYYQENFEKEIVWY